MPSPLSRTAQRGTTRTAAAFAAVLVGLLIACAGTAAHTARFTATANRTAAASEPATTKASGPATNGGEPTATKAGEPATTKASGPAAIVSRVMVYRAAASSRSALRSLRHAKHRLRRCQRAHRRNRHACARQRRSVRRARGRLAHSDRQLHALRTLLARAARKATGKQTQKKTGSGTTVSGSGTGTTSGTSTGTTSGTSTGTTSETSTGTTSGTSTGTTTGTSTGSLGEGTAGGELASASGPFQMGVVAGSALTYELPFIETLHAHTARLEFSIGTPASQLAPVVEAYAKAGIKPLLLAGFYGTMPSVAEAQNLASWAQEFGPGGTLWQGREFPAGTAVTDIEFGNETSYAYQYPETASASNWYDLASYALRAQTYALRFLAAYEAIHFSNSRVGLLAQADDGGSGSSEWVNNMFKAVPNLGQIAAGWTIHPYGPKWEAAIDRLISQTAAAGASSSIPIYVTEWGLASDDGRCLSDNYGFNRCMTYSEAATTLESNLAAMRSRYGSRLAAFYLFQARDQDATGTSTEREGYFGALQSDQAPKGAYTTTVQSLLASNP